MIRPDGLSVRHTIVWTRLDVLVNVFAASGATPQVVSITRGAGDDLG